MTALIFLTLAYHGMTAIQCDHGAHRCAERRSGAPLNPLSIYRAAADEQRILRKTKWEQTAEHSDTVL